MRHSGAVQATTGKVSNYTLENTEGRGAKIDNPEKLAT